MVGIAFNSTYNTEDLLLECVTLCVGRNGLGCVGGLWFSIGLKASAARKMLRKCMRELRKNVTIVDASISSNPRQMAANENTIRAYRTMTNIGKKKIHGNGRTKLTGALSLRPTKYDRIKNISSFILQTHRRTLGRHLFVSFSSSSN